MISKRQIRNYAIAAGLILSSIVADTAVEGRFSSHLLVSSAQARIGRPLTPLSVAGVARRTIRRSTIYHATLPVGCATVHINGVSLWHCGGVYYEASGGRYVVVYVH